QMICLEPQNNPPCIEVVQTRLQDRPRIPFAGYTNGEERVYETELWMWVGNWSGNSDIDVIVLTNYRERGAGRRHKRKLQPGDLLATGGQGGAHLWRTDGP